MKTQILSLDQRNIPAIDGPEGVKSCDTIYQCSCGCNLFEVYGGNYYTAGRCAECYAEYTIHEG